MDFGRRGMLFALGASAFGSGRPIRAAVYGAGHAHARSKTQVLRAMPEFKLVGICEPRPGPLAHPAFEGIPVLSSEEMLSDP